MDRSIQPLGSSTTINSHYKLNYGKRLRISLICSLSLCIILLRITTNILPHPSEPVPSKTNIQLVEIPPTDYPPSAQVPLRPSIPIPSKEEDLPENITIQPSQFDQFTPLALPPPPSPEPNLRKTRQATVQKPEPEGGYEALQQNIEYPSIARDAGMEGTVVIRAYIDRTGRVSQTEVLEGDIRTGFTQAAIAGIRKTPFTPARQFDETIGYWDSITVRFKIRE